MNSGTGRKDFANTENISDGNDCPADEQSSENKLMERMNEAEANCWTRAWENFADTLPDQAAGGW